MPGLGTSFGRGGATTALQDLQNADAILIVGSSMAENHPVGFRWVIDAREKGATVIHVDPRFTRTSAMADMWVPLRAGSDIVFLGAMVNYVLTHDLEFRDYVVAYTNASTIIDDAYAGPDDLDGLFSGWDAGEKRYSTASWAYDEGGRARSDASAPSLGVSDPDASLRALHAGDGGRGLRCAGGSFLRIADAFCRARDPSAPAPSATPSA